MSLQGWIEEVVNGTVYGRLVDEDSDEYCFDMPILSIPECQRVDLEPGVYITIVNGFVLIDKTLWTTLDMELADEDAEHYRAVLARS